MELYKKHRPQQLQQMIGQDNLVSILESLFEEDELPHSFLFTGPSGCGKTTLARIIRRKIKCSKHDFIEGAPRKIDDVRRIRDKINLAPLKGNCRIWLIDECHKLTSDSQDEFLKILEDTPSHIYFILTTTEPQKIKKTIRNRCTELAVVSLSNKNLKQLIHNVCKLERKKIEGEVVEKIIENSNGSARKALVFLHQIIQLKSKSEMLNAIITTTVETQAIAVARALFNKKTNWSTIAKILKEVQGEEAEQIRWLVLGYAKTIMLSGSKLAGRAYIVIDAFGDNFYDSKHAGLCAACYEIMGEK